MARFVIRIVAMALLGTALVLAALGYHHREALVARYARWRLATWSPMGVELFYTAKFEDLRWVLERADPSEFGDPNEYEYFGSSPDDPRYVVVLPWAREDGGDGGVLVLTQITTGEVPILVGHRYNSAGCPLDMSWLLPDGSPIEQASVDRRGTGPGDAYLRIDLARPWYGDAKLRDAERRVFFALGAFPPSAPARIESRQGALQRQDLTDMEALLGEPVDLEQATRFAATLRARSAPDANILAALTWLGAKHPRGGATNHTLPGEVPEATALWRACLADPAIDARVRALRASEDAWVREAAEAAAAASTSAK